MIDPDGLLRRPTAPPPDHQGQHERPEVCIFEAPADVWTLVDALSNIGFRTIANPPVEDPNFPRDAGAFAAVVIADGAHESLKLAGELSPNYPVLYIASELSIENWLAAARAGVDTIVSRPIELRELADWLNDHVGRYRERQLSVLVVDDDEILAETYALALENAGISAFVATNSTAALDQIMSKQIDLVLLDIQMPNVSGIDLAKAVRQSRRYLSIPIVFLSFERDPTRQFEARSLAGDDFISKPIDLQQLVPLVRMKAQRAISLRKMMDRDGLTGLLNQGRFIDRLRHEMERCRRTGAELSLVFVDIDHFKSVNDTYGHICGDHVLRTLARVLSIGLRQIDTVGRYGGEEFAVLLHNTAPEAACGPLERIRRNFSQLEFRGKDAPFFVTFSAGIAGSRRYSTTEDLIFAADQNMYRAKAAGRNRIVVK